MATSAKSIKPTRRKKGAVLPKKERERILSEAKAFAGRNPAALKRVLALLGTSDTFMTPEELSEMRARG